MFRAKFLEKVKRRGTPLNKKKGYTPKGKIVVPSKDSITKTIRLNAEDTAVLEHLMEQKGLSWSGAIHHLIGSRGTPQNEEGVHPKNKEKGTPQEEKKPLQISSRTRDEIINMCELCGITTVEFFDEVCRLFNEGKLEVEGKTVKCNGEYDLRELEEVCHLNNVTVENALEKTIRSMMRR